MTRYRTIRPGLAVLVLVFFIVSGFFTSHARAGKEEIPGPARRVLFQAQNLMQEGKTAEAVPLLESYLQKKPSPHHLVPFFLGNAWLTLGKPDKALPYLEKSVELDRGFAEGWRNLGRCLYELGRFNRAAEAFLGCYEAREKKDPDMLFHAASAYSAGEMDKEAGKIFSRLLASCADACPLAWKEGAARAWILTGQTEKALPLMEELAAETFGETRKQWRQALLYHYMAREEADKALSRVREWVDQDPLEPLWWKTLFRLNLAENHPDKALSPLIVGGFLAPLSPEESLALGDLCLNQGLPEEAARVYEGLLEKEWAPDLAQKAAIARIRNFEPDKALQWVDKGLEKRDDPKLWVLKGRLLYKAGDYQDAAPAFLRAASLEDKPGPAWLWAGQAAYLAGDWDLAEKSLVRAQKHQPSEKNAERLLKRIQAEKALIRGPSGEGT